MSIIRTSAPTQVNVVEQCLNAILKKTDEELKHSARRLVGCGSRVVDAGLLVEAIRLVALLNYNNIKSNCWHNTCMGEWRRNNDAAFVEMMASIRKTKWKNFTAFSRLASSGLSRDKVVQIFNNLAPTSTLVAKITNVLDAIKTSTHNYSVITWEQITCTTTTVTVNIMAAQSLLRSTNTDTTTFIYNYTQTHVHTLQKIPPFVG